MEDEAEDSEDEEYQQLGRNWLMVHENVKLQRFQTFIIWLILVVFLSFLFLSYKPRSGKSQQLIRPEVGEECLESHGSGWQNLSSCGV